MKVDQEIWDQISDEGKTRIIFNDPSSETKERMTPTRVNRTETNDQEELDPSGREEEGRELLEWSKEKASAETHVADIKKVLSSSANSISRKVNPLDPEAYP